MRKEIEDLSSSIVHNCVVKIERLHGRKINEHLRKKGRVWKGKQMNIKWLPGAPKHPNVDPTKVALYVGTAASVKVHKSAVKRNRMRRRCREALRLIVTEEEKLATAQLLLSPRSSSLDCTFEDIRSDVYTFLTHLR